MYDGPSAFSEPESQNAKWMFDNFPNIAFFVDLHSFGEGILYSSSFGSCVGVDVNRNYDFLWNFPQYFSNSVTSCRPRTTVMTTSTSATKKTSKAPPVAAMTAATSPPKPIGSYGSNTCRVDTRPSWRASERSPVVIDHRPANASSR